MYCHSARRVLLRHGRELRPIRKSVAPRPESRWATGCVLAVSIFATTGCYTVRSVPLRKIDQYPSRETVSQMTVAAEPFRDRACAKVFNHRLNNKGFLPVLIVVENTSDGDATLIGSDVQLIDDAGQTHLRVPSSVLAAKYERMPGLEAFLLFGWISFMDANRYNDALKADWGEKELGQRVIVHAHSTVHGFAYFELKNRPRAENLKVIVSIIDDAKQHHEISLTAP